MRKTRQGTVTELGLAGQGRTGWRRTLRKEKGEPNPAKLGEQQGRKGQESAEHKGKIPRRENNP